MAVALVTNFRTSRDMVARGWGVMRKSGGRWEFVPQLDQMVTVPGITGKMHRRVAPLVIHLIGWLETHRGRRLDPVGNWGLSVRPIRGAEAAAYAGQISAWSLHSGGLAFDVEAPRNPLGVTGRGDFPDGWLEECHRYGFGWGANVPIGDYVGRPDRMHIEFLGTPDQADAYVALLPGAPIEPAPRPRVPNPGDDVMYIKCQPNKDQPEWVAILAGPMFVQIVTEGEVDSANGEIEKGAICQWVEKATWDDLDRRSHALCDNPRPVVVQPAVQA